MHEQDAAEFGDGLRVVISAVVIWDDELGGGAGEVRAEVRDDAVTAVGSVAFPAIADNGVVRDLDRDAVKGGVERVLGGEAGDAGELALLDEIGGEIDEGAGDGGGE